MHLTLHLTSRCNLRCWYCYAAPHQGGDMTFETAKAAIKIGMDSLQRKSPGASLGVIFFGGEPLIMRGLIEEIVEHCRGIERDTGQLFHYKITTNGTMLDESFLTSPITSEVFIAMSHDGIKAAHDSGRVDAGGNGTFDALEPKIDMLLEHKPYSPVMMVVNPGNVRHYYKSIVYLYGKGFRYLICSLDYGADWTEKDLNELEKQYKKLSDWYYKLMMAEEKFYYSPFEVKISSHVFPGSCKAERCELGQTQISVAPNGRLYPCVQFVGDGSDTAYAIGDVFNGVDEDARMRLYLWNGEEKSTCGECAVRERCNHYCGCLNKQATGHIDQVSPVLCAHERLILPIVDKLAARLFEKRSPMFIQKHYNEMFPVISLVEDRTKGSK